MKAVWNMPELKSDFGARVTVGLQSWSLVFRARVGLANLHSAVRIRVLKKKREFCIHEEDSDE